MIYVRNLGNGNYSTNILPFDLKFGERNKDGMLMTNEEMLNEGFFIDKFPEPEIIEGKVAAMKVDFDKQEIYYQYIDEIVDNENPIDPISVLTQTVANTQIENIKINNILQENTKEIAKIKLELIENKGCVK